MTKTETWRAILAGPRIRRWVLFMVGGSLNAAITFAIYLIASRFVNYQLAYGAGYVAGIAFSYFFNATFVFRTRLSFRGAAVYPVVYICQYLLSAGCLGLMVELLHVAKWIAPLLVTVLMIIPTYLLSKAILNLTQPKAAGKA